MVDKHDAPFLIFIGIVLTTVSSVVIVSDAFEEPDAATGNQSRGFDNIVDAHGRVQAVSETAASWEECMDMAQERIVYGISMTFQIAQMEWDIAVCDRLFPADGIAEPDLTAPGAIP